MDEVYKPYKVSIAEDAQVQFSVIGDVIEELSRQHNEFRSDYNQAWHDALGQFMFRLERKIVDGDL